MYIYTLSCDGCGKNVDIKEKPEGARGWLDLHPIDVDDDGPEDRLAAMFGKAAPKREFKRTTKGQFCTPECAITYLHTVVGIPTIEYKDATTTETPKGGHYL